MSRAVDSTARAMAGEALSRLDNGSSGSGGTTVDAYSKLETDNLLNAKVDDVEFAPIKTLAESNEVNITYLAENKAEKTEVDTLSELVAEIDDELDLKANKADVYTKAETDTAVSNKVAEIIANAPEDFDTLKEMSDWIDSHEESASAMNTAIKQNTSDIANLKATDEITATEIAGLQEQITANKNNVADIMIGVYLYNKSYYGTFTDGYVMRVGNQVHINCKIEVTKEISQWVSVVLLPFKVKSPNSDGSRYTITNTQSDGRTTSIYINDGSESFFSSTTFQVGDVIEVKGLILDMYVDDTTTTQEA